MSSCLLRGQRGEGAHALPLIQISGLAQGMHLGGLGRVVVNWQVLQTWKPEMVIAKYMPKSLAMELFHSYLPPV